MALTTEQKMQVMSWAVALAKLEFKAQRNMLGSSTTRAINALDALKISDAGKPEKKEEDLQTIVSTYYQFLLKQIDG